MKKRINNGFLFLLTLFTILGLTSCGVRGDEPINNPSKDPEGGGSEVVAPDPATGDTNQDDVNKDNTQSGTYDQDEDETVVTITLGSTPSVYDNDGSVTILNQVVQIDNSSKTTYLLSGTLSNGHIEITGSKACTLVLNGVSITSQDTAAIFKTGKKKLTIVSPEGSVNYVEDGTTYSTSTSEDSDVAGVNACVYAKNGLSLEGSGKLQVKSNFNNGVGSKDEVEIKETNLVVSSVNNGIKANDYLKITSGEIKVTSTSDGIKADNDELVDSETGLSLGYIEVTGGTIHVTSANDAIQASNYVTISGGEFNLTSGGGYNQKVATDASAKGIKGTEKLTISGGTFNLSSADDCFHTNGTLEISGGEILLTSGDDGIHADEQITISGGNITITKSYEGIEATKIYLNGGTISLYSTDDGINAAGGNDTIKTGGWMGPGQSSGNGYLEINEGVTLYVNADGDGLDANGSIVMNGGNVTIDGQTKNGNGAIDYDSSFVLNGGTLISVEKYDRMQTQNVTSSSQYCVLVALDTAYSANSVIEIKDSSGNVLFETTPKKTFSAIVFSSTRLSSGNISIYINQTLVKTITLSSTYVVTSGGYSSNQPGWGPGNPR